MGFRDELEAAISRGDALQKRIELLEHQIESPDAAEYVAEIQRLTTERDIARAEIDRINARTRILEERLKQNMGTEDSASMPTLRSHNKDVAVSDDYFREAGRLGVECPQCRTDEVNEELVHGPGKIVEISDKRLAFLSAICPRCLFSANFGWVPRPVTFKIHKNGQFIREVVSARATARIGNSTSDTVYTAEGNFNATVRINNLPYGVQLDAIGGPVTVNGHESWQCMLASGDELTCHHREIFVVVVFE